MKTPQATQPPAIVEIDQNGLMASFRKEGGLVHYCDIIAKRAEELKAEVPTDMSVGKNRKELKSIGAKIGKMNARFGEARKMIADNLLEKIKVVTDEIAIVNAEGKYAADFFKKLREDIPAEAFAWEEEEKKLQEALGERIQKFKECGQAEGDEEKLNRVLTYLEQQHPTADFFGKRLDEALTAKAAAIESIKKEIELTRLRAAEEKRKADEEKAGIRQRAKEEAEKRLEEEKLAAKIKEKEAAETRSRLQKERVNEIRRFGIGILESSSDGIKYRLELLHQTELTEENFGELLPEAREAYMETQAELNGQLEITVEREKKEAEERAAQEKADLEREAAAELERQKQKEREEQEKKAADKAHRKEVHARIVQDMTAAGFTKEDAGAIVYAISQGKIRDLNISY